MSNTKPTRTAAIAETVAFAALAITLVTASGTAFGEAPAPTYADQVQAHYATAVTGPALDPAQDDPMVVFSFDGAPDGCEAVLADFAVGAPVPVGSAQCLVEYVLEPQAERVQAAQADGLDDPANAMFSASPFGLVGSPDPLACEQALPSLAVGQALPVAVADCVAAYVAPHSDAVADNLPITTDADTI